MRKLDYIIAASILVTGIFLSLVIAVEASSPFDIEFPIPELGNCGSKEECKTYCDDITNAEACMAFAERHGLASKDEARKVRAVARAGGGPGGCQTKDSCEAYCENPDNMDECIAFAEEHGVVEGEELQKMKKAAQLMREGVETPGGCRSPRECRSYCDNPDNMEECLAFAERAGFLPPEELKQARAFMSAMRSGETPGGCRGERECRSYCDNPDNMEECMAFAERHGIVRPEEAGLAREIMERGGPGGCKNHRECEAFCNNPDNAEACFEFAGRHGLIGEEEIQHAREGFQKFREGFQNAPPEIAECLKNTVGEEVIEKIERGEIAPGPRLGKAMKSCFENFAPPGFGPEGPPGHEAGPDGRGGFFENSPPEVVSCVREKVGDAVEELRSGNVPPGPEVERAMRSCFDEFNRRFERGGFEGGGNDGFQEDDFEPRFGPEDRTSPSRDHLEGLPFDVRSCIERRVGGDIGAKMQSGELDPERLRGVIQSCFEEIRQNVEERTENFPPPEFDGEHQEFQEFQEFEDHDTREDGAAAVMSFFERWRSRVGK